MTPTIFAITTHGLEDVSADEMKLIPGTEIVELSYRKITAIYNGNFALLLKLKTVDDIFIHLANWHGIPKQRMAIADIQARSSNLNLLEAHSITSSVREIADNPSFSVTINFVGKRNYSSKEIKNAVSEGIQANSGWVYFEDDQKSDFNIRVFIEHEDAYVGLRLGKQSLQKRSYKETHVGGSLKPPVAAAMVAMLKVTGDVIVDPFCGAGTILIEAGLHGFNGIGGDYNNQALSAARINSKSAGIDLCLNLWDSLALPLSKNSVECVISNLPWGRQIAVGPDIEMIYRHFCLELERILNPTGQALLLTTSPDLIRTKKFDLKICREISVFGQRPSLVLLSSG